MGKRFALSISSGLILGLSWVEITGFFPLIFIALVPFLILEEEILVKKLSSWKVYVHALIIFILFNLISTWWIYHSSPEGSILAFVLGSALVAIPFWFFHLTRRYIGKQEGYIAFVVNILAFEWIDYNWPLSHPWLPFGNAFAGFPNIIQWYEFTGVEGGSLWVILINLIAFSIWKKYRKEHSIKALKGQLALIVALLVLPISLSYIILNGVDTGENNPTIGVVLSQPNIDPYEKFDGGPTALEQTRNLLKVVESSIDENTRLIIAPETALPNSLEENQIEYSDEVQMTQIFLKKYPKISLLTGASTHAFFDKENSSASKEMDRGGFYESYNSTLLINQSVSVSIYHKMKLVLGTETLPFEFITKPLESFFDLGGTSGTLGTETAPKNFKIGNAVVAPTICYESIYGEFIGEFSVKGANIISVSTNDAWWHNHNKCLSNGGDNNQPWHDTPGYRQLLAYTQLRAIENRKWIARSANTGITCFINPKGEIVKSAEWGVANSISMDVPLMEGTTFYAKNGDYISRVALFIAPLLLLLTFVRRFKNGKV